MAEDGDSTLLLRPLATGLTLDTGGVVVISRAGAVDTAESGQQQVQVSTVTTSDQHQSINTIVIIIATLVNYL